MVIDGLFLVGHINTSKSVNTMSLRICHVFDTFHYAFTCEQYCRVFGKFMA